MLVPIKVRGPLRGLMTPILTLFIAAPGFAASWAKAGAQSSNAATKETANNREENLLPMEFLLFFGFTWIDKQVVRQSHILLPSTPFLRVEIVAARM